MASRIDPHSSLYSSPSRGPTTLRVVLHGGRLSALFFSGHLYTSCRCKDTIRMLTFFETGFPVLSNDIPAPLSQKWNATGPSGLPVPDPTLTCSSSNFTIAYADRSRVAGRVCTDDISIAGSAKHQGQTIGYVNEWSQTLSLADG